MSQKELYAVAGLALALALFGAVPPAQGQAGTWAGKSLETMIDKAQWKFGPLRGNTSLTVANAGYESDIYYGYLTDAVPDFSLAASIPVQVLFPLGKKVVLEIYDSPQYLFYLSTKRERAWNNAFRGQVHLSLDRLYVQASAGRSNVRQRLSPELDINVRLKEDRLNGTVLYQVSQKGSLAFLYRVTNYDHGDAQFEGTQIGKSLNRREDFFDLVAYVQPNSGMRFYLDGQFGTSKFADPTATYKNARSYGVFGGLDFIPAVENTKRVAKIQGGIGLGYMRFDMVDPARVDGSDFIGNVRVSVRLKERITARASFSRGFQYSIYSGATYYVSLNYGGGLEYLLSRHASVSYDIYFARSNYPVDETGGGVVREGVFNLYTTHMFGLNIRVARQLTVTVTGMLGKRAADPTSLARNRNFFGLSFVYGAATGTVSAPSSPIAR